MPREYPRRESQHPGFTHEQIRELVELVSQKGIEEVEVEGGDFRLRIVGRRAPAAAPVLAPPSPSPPPAPSPVAPTAAPAPAAPETPIEAGGEFANLKLVTAPMIGTLYRAPAPDAPAFAEVGDHVTEDSVLCIIEAMKLMNEIKAEMRGTVRRVLVENGMPVEYGQPIAAIEPD